MNNDFNSLSPQEDSDIKFSKLCEIVQDIETNGNDGDQFPRQAVFSAIMASENIILWNQLEKTLLEKNQSELMRTVIVGLLMQKGNILPLCEYAEDILDGIKVINEEFDNKESLLLLADALVKGACSENIVERDICIKSLSNLYQLSCHPESSSIMADHLLQRFMNILPQKSKVIDDCLLKLITNSDAEINVRLISIDILGRSNPIEFYYTVEDMVSNIQQYAASSTEKLYLLDVLTKYIYSVTVSNLGIKFSALSKVLNEIKMTDILNDIKENTDSDPEHFDILAQRILKRISHINKQSNSLN